jgi:ABC-2 type transport system permease protein
MARRHVFRESAAFALVELRHVHSWRIWLFGWLVRLFSQATFFATVGLFVGDGQLMRYVLIGNIVVLSCQEAMLVVLSARDERAAGTLSLLAVAPASHVPIYLGRGLQWVVSGFCSSLLVWLVLPPALGVRLPWPAAAAAVPVMLLVGLSSYAYGCFLAGVAVRRLGVEWVMLNLGYLVVMVLAGVNVPVSFWPGWLSAVAELLPVTHGLHAVRVLLAGGPAGDVLRSVFLEAVVGIGWLVLAAVSFDRLVSRGRRDGSLEYSS